MKLQLHGAAGKDLQVSELAFGKEFNESLIHQVVTAFMAAGRSGTKAQKTRSEVSGGGIKPWRQKGTGRARAGTIRSPIWVGGGRAFAAKPRNFEQKVNRKMYRGAMRSLLSELVRQERLIVVESLELAEAKTKLFVEQMKSLGVTGGLFVIEAFEEKLWLASRNLPHVEMLEASALDPVSLLRHEHVVITVAALRRVEENLG
ncbi:50S ribosomal protein L4 [Wenzhouxiangella sp. XN24]|uniref:50S ribosomal protein L4 n=1 Tax=Wenzhouxiangella sp. XN24 TaxID=2713569 RepID=UPI0013EE362F|nr:50S ribosomal protein L4 [Wenzhouxiangella sp. XN24]NGX16196.1 50S ribosomal protein L4 [Wenzhouxiangella sp. XN24]